MTTTWVSPWTRDYNEAFGVVGLAQIFVKVGDRPDEFACDVDAALTLRMGRDDAWSDPDPGVLEFTVYDRSEHGSASADWKVGEKVALTVEIGETVPFWTGEIREIVRKHVWWRYPTSNDPGEDGNIVTVRAAGPLAPAGRLRVERNFPKQKEGERVKAALDAAFPGAVAVATDPGLLDTAFQAEIADAPGSGVDWYWSRSEQVTRRSPYSFEVAAGGVLRLTSTLPVILRQRDSIVTQWAFGQVPPGSEIELFVREEGTGSWVPPATGDITARPVAHNLALKGVETVADRSDVDFATVELVVRCPAWGVVDVGNVRIFHSAYDTGTVDVRAIVANQGDPDATDALRDVIGNAARAGVGYLSETRSGKIIYHDNLHRFQRIPYVTLDACEILADLETSELDDVANQIEVKWGLTDDAVKAEIITNPDADLVGVRGSSFGGDHGIADRADAVTIGTSLLRIQETSRQILDSITVDLSLPVFTEAKVRTLLMMPLGAHIVLTNLPPSVLKGRLRWDGFVEGFVITREAGGRWVMQMNVTDPWRALVSPRWKDLPTGTGSVKWSDVHEPDPAWVDMLLVAEGDADRVLRSGV